MKKIQDTNMDKMNKFIRIGVILLASLMIIQKLILDYTLYPYLAVRKAERGEFKTACAYVAYRERKKHNSFIYHIKIDDDWFKDWDIINRYAPDLPSKYRDILYNFPIHQKQKDFLVEDLMNCKQIQFVEIYNFLWFKKIYLYDYIKHP